MRPYSIFHTLPAALFRASLNTLTNKVWLNIFNRRRAFGTSALLSIALLSGCNMTSQDKMLAPLVSLHDEQRMNPQCVEQVQTLQSSINSPTMSQFIAIANTAQHCVEGIQFSPQHPDLKTAMQFTALAFVSFVQAGDMQSASKTLSNFRATFPQQDLFFDDFTSFVDTATVLIKQADISPHQLASLNINPTLRAEIKRHRQWSLR